MNFFEIEDHRNRAKRWRLASIFSPSGIIEEWIFTIGEKYESSETLTIKFSRLWRLKDFNMCGYDVPIVSSKVAAILNRYVLLDVQLIPVYTEDEGETWYIVNALKSIHCLDEKHSIFEKDASFCEGSESMQDYRNVSKLVIDSNGLEMKNMFRVKGWDVALIVSDVLREQFELADIKGILYSPV